MCVDSAPNLARFRAGLFSFDLLDFVVVWESSYNIVRHPQQPLAIKFAAAFWVRAIGEVGN